MVEEIIYTSAEKGLKQGSRGFCTVVSTTGMALNLAERLESMSGYRQAFPLHDPKASLNPVCWSHMTTRLAGRSLHVISRVADAGQDYTGRSNKLAHHLVIDNVASLNSGPARMLAEPGVVADRWDGTVRHIPPRDLRSAPMPATIPLVAWKALTGDEGWAGSVAEQLLQSPAPVSIIFDPGTDTLTLVREVLDLIPAAQRWNVTFSTYFTRLLAGAECQLRFVLNDTPEATILRNDARARVVDLTNSLPAATGGTLVAMARQGQLTPQEIAPPQAAPTAARSRASAETSTKDTAAEISIPKLKPGLSPLAATNKPQPPPEFGPQRRSKKPLIVGSIAVVLCIVALVGVVSRPSRQPKDGYTTAISNSQAIAQNEDEAAKATEKWVQPSAQTNPTPQDVAAIPPQQTKVMPEVDTDRKPANDELENKKIQEKGPFALIKEKEDFRDKWHQFLFNLPKPAERYTGDWPQLRCNGEKISLSLCEAAKPLFAACSYQLKMIQDPIRLNEWNVEATQEGTKELIAKYTLHDLQRDVATLTEPDMELRFEWSPSASREIMASELLRWWPLQIQVGNRKAVLLQRTAETPDTAGGRPTWRGLLNSEKIAVINTSATKAIGFDKAANATFTIEIAQPDFVIQKIELPIMSETLPEGTESSEALSKGNVGEKYFLLSTPIQLFDKEPDVTDQLTGFGRLGLSVSQTATAGLTLTPKISLILRLPSADVLDKLPDISTNAGLKQIDKDPRNFTSWNPALAQGAITNLQNTRVELRNEIRNWHTQELKRVPRKESFESNTFFQLSKNALKEVRGVIPAFAKEVNAAEIVFNRLNANSGALQGIAGGQEQLNQASLLLKQARAKLQDAEKYQPRIEEFAIAMGEMTREMTATNVQLLKDYDTICVQVNSCIAATEGIQLRCILSGHVDTGECDTGSKVVIYFLETTSPNWPADATQPEAK